MSSPDGAEPPWVGIRVPGMTLRRCHPEGGARRIFRATRRGRRAVAGRRASCCTPAPGDPMVGRMARQARCFAAQILRCAQDDKTFGLTRPSACQDFRHAKTFSMPRPSACQGLRHAKTLRCHPEGGARRTFRATRRGRRAVAGRRASCCMAAPGDPMVGRMARQAQCFAEQILRCAQNDKEGCSERPTQPGKFRKSRVRARPRTRTARAWPRATAA